MLTNARLSLQSLALHLLLEELSPLALHYESLCVESVTSVHLVGQLSLLQNPFYSFLLLSLHFLHLLLLLLCLLFRLLLLLLLFLRVHIVTIEYDLFHGQRALLDSLIHVEELDRGLFHLSITSNTFSNLFLLPHKGQIARSVEGLVERRDDALGLLSFFLLLLLFLHSNL